MKDRVLVDTNILVYAYDTSNPEKQAKAFQIIDKLAMERKGVLSSQILGEFFVTVTQKIKPPLDPAVVSQSVQNYLRSWLVLDMTPQIVLEAIRGRINHQISYWDAQVWATAKLYQIPKVYSEDFQDGQMLEGVLFINPFKN
ncbi:MAG TPA: PIN domain-containing protein [Bacillota bacterium]|nr:PIN domain-containing protein [Bacillota bacterium]